MQILQEKIEGSFFGKLRSKLNIFIVLHFCYIHDILQAEVFCDAYTAPNSFSPGLWPGPRWGSLRRSPRPSQLGREYPLPIPHPVDACRASP